MKVTAEKRTNILVMHVSGSVTMDNSGGLVAQFKSHLAPDCRACILELSDLQMLDSSGIGALALCVDAASASGVKLLVSGLGGRALQAVQLAKADRFLKLYPDVDSAVASVAAT